MQKQNIKTYNMSTLGEKRVRVDFNTTGNTFVDTIKRDAAKLIDLVDSAASDPSWSEEKTREYLRLKALALTSLEEAAMWAVKSATI